MGRHCYGGQRGYYSGWQNAGPNYQPCPAPAPAPCSSYPTLPARTGVSGDLAELSARQTPPTMQQFTKCVVLQIPRGADVQITWDRATSDGGVAHGWGLTMRQSNTNFTDPDIGVYMRRNGSKTDQIEIHPYHHFRGTVHLTINGRTYDIPSTGIAQAKPAKQKTEAAHPPATERKPERQPTAPSRHRHDREPSADEPAPAPRTQRKIKAGERPQEQQEPEHAQALPHGPRTHPPIAPLQKIRHPLGATTQTDPKQADILRGFTPEDLERIATEMAKERPGLTEQTKLRLMQVDILGSILNEVRSQTLDPKTLSGQAMYYIGATERVFGRSGIRDNLDRERADIERFQRDEYPKLVQEVLGGKDVMTALKDLNLLEGGPGQRTPLLGRIIKDYCQSGQGTDHEFHLSDPKSLEDVNGQRLALIAFYRDLKNPDAAAAAALEAFGDDLRDYGTKNLSQKLVDDLRDQADREAAKIRGENEVEWRKKGMTGEQIEAFQKSLADERFDFMFCRESAKIFEPEKVLSGAKLKAWQDYNDIIDPKGEWFNLTDATWHAIQRELIINVPLIVVSGGAGTITRMGATALCRTVGTRVLGKMAERGAFTIATTVAARTAEATAFNVVMSAAHGENFFARDDVAWKIFSTAATLSALGYAGRKSEALFTTAVLKDGKPLLDSAGKVVTQAQYLGRVSEHISNPLLRESFKQLIAKGHAEAATMLLTDAALNGMYEGGYKGALEEIKKVFGDDHAGERYLTALITVGALKVSHKGGEWGVQTATGKFFGAGSNSYIVRFDSLSAEAQAEYVAARETLGLTKEGEWASDAAARRARQNRSSTGDQAALDAALATILAANAKGTAAADAIVAAEAERLRANDPATPKFGSLSDAEKQAYVAAKETLGLSADETLVTEAEAEAAEGNVRSRRAQGDFKAPTLEAIDAARETIRKGNERAESAAREAVAAAEQAARETAASDSPVAQRQSIFTRIARAVLPERWLGRPEPVLQEFSQIESSEQQAYNAAKKTLGIDDLDGWVSKEEAAEAAAKQNLTIPRRVSPEQVTEALRTIDQIEQRHRTANGASANVPPGRFGMLTDNAQREYRIAKVQLGLGAESDFVSDQQAIEARERLTAPDYVDPQGRDPEVFVSACDRILQAHRVVRQHGMEPTPRDAADPVDTKAEQSESAPPIADPPVQSAPTTRTGNGSEPTSTEPARTELPEPALLEGWSQLSSEQQLTYNTVRKDLGIIGTGPASNAEIDAAVDRYVQQLANRQSPEQLARIRELCVTHAEKMKTLNAEALRIGEEAKQARGEPAQRPTTPPSGSAEASNSPVTASSTVRLTSAEWRTLSKSERQEYADCRTALGIIGENRPISDASIDKAEGRTLESIPDAHRPVLEPIYKTAATRLRELNQQARERQQTELLKEAEPVAEPPVAAETSTAPAAPAAADIRDAESRLSKIIGEPVTQRNLPMLRATMERMLAKEQSDASGSEAAIKRYQAALADIELLERAPADKDGNFEVRSEPKPEEVWDSLDFEIGEPPARTRTEEATQVLEASKNFLGEPLTTRNIETFFQNLEVYQAALVKFARAMKAGDEHAMSEAADVMGQLCKDDAAIERLADTSDTGDTNKLLRALYDENQRVARLQRDLEMIETMPRTAGGEFRPTAASRPRYGGLTPAEFREWRAIQSHLQPTFLSPTEPFYDSQLTKFDFSSPISERALTRMEQGLSNAKEANTDKSGAPIDAAKAENIAELTELVARIRELENIRAQRKAEYVRAEDSAPAEELETSVSPQETNLPASTESVTSEAASEQAPREVQAREAAPQTSARRRVPDQRFRNFTAEEFDQYQVALRELDIPIGPSGFKYASGDTAQSAKQTLVRNSRLSGEARRVYETQLQEHVDTIERLNPKVVGERNVPRSERTRSEPLESFKADEAVLGLKAGVLSEILSPFVDQAHAARLVQSGQSSQLEVELSLGFFGAKVSEGWEASNFRNSQDLADGWTFDQACDSLNIPADVRVQLRDAVADAATPRLAAARNNPEVSQQLLDVLTRYGLHLDARGDIHEYVPAETFSRSASRSRNEIEEAWQTVRRAFGRDVTIEQMREQASEIEELLRRELDSANPSENYIAVCNRTLQAIHILESLPSDSAAESSQP